MTNHPLLRLSAIAFALGRGVALAMDYNAPSAMNKTPGGQAAGQEAYKRIMGNMTSSQRERTVHRSDLNDMVTSLLDDVDIQFDDDVSDVEAYYQQLRHTDRTSLEKIVGGRLDPSHLKSEPRSSLVVAALETKFGRNRVAAWGAAQPPRSRAMDAKTYTPEQQARISKAKEWDHLEEKVIDKVPLTAQEKSRLDAFRTDALGEQDSSDKAAHRHYEESLKKRT